MRLQLCSMLVVTLALFCLPLPAAPQANTSQNQNTSQKDKAKKCEETAKNKGLKGDERATFISTCMSTKDAASSAANNMSPQEKQKADKAQSCEQQATQKGLTGKDRKTFMKTCTGA